MSFKYEPAFFFFVPLFFFFPIFFFSLLFFAGPLANAALPHGGLRKFRSPQILGCYVTKFAPHEALKLIA